MAKSLVDLRKNILSGLDAETAIPVYNAIHNDNLDRWINESAQDVIVELMEASKDQFADAKTHLQALMVYEVSISCASGTGKLPATFLYCLHFMVGGKRAVRLSAAEFGRWDNSNWAYVSRTDKPLYMIGAGAVKYKPTSLTTGKMTHLKKHPVITTSQSTVFSEYADNLLIGKVVLKALSALEIGD